MKKNLLMIVLLICLTACSGNGLAATMTPTLIPLSTATLLPNQYIDGALPADVESSIPMTIDLTTLQRLKQLNIKPTVVEQKTGLLTGTRTENRNIRLVTPKTIGSSTTIGEILTNRTDYPYFSQYADETVPAESVLNAFPRGLPEGWFVTTAATSTGIPELSGAQEGGSVIVVFGNPQNSNELFAMDGSFGSIEITINGDIIRIDGKEPAIVNLVTGEQTTLAAVFHLAAIELSSEQLVEKNFVGSGFELRTEFQGIPVDLTVVTSKATLTQYQQTRGCMPNQEMVKYGASAEDRMAEMVFLGHYVGYLRYSGRTEAGYPFTQYIADLKASADRSYTIWGPRLDGSDGEFKVNPLSPVEYVTTNAVVDPDGNGRGTALMPDNVVRLGYQQLENGGVRIVKSIGTHADYFKFCVTSSRQFSQSILSLGVRLEFLQGLAQLIQPNNYPTTEAKLNTDVIDMQIYNDSNGLLSPTLLVP